MNRIAVLMPVRNGAGTVRAAVLSTLSAMGSNDRLLVMDDGSTDDTSAVLALCQRDARVEVYRSEKSQGVAAALNELLARADAHYIARMDADDLTLPGRFAVQRRRLTRADVTFGNTVFLQSGKLSFHPASLVAQGTSNLGTWLLAENLLAHSAVMMHAGVLKALGGYRLVAAEDYDLWLRAVKAGYVVERHGWPVIVYRRHEAQVTSSQVFADRARAEGFTLEAWKDLLDATDPTATHRVNCERSDLDENQRRYVNDFMGKHPVPPPGRLLADRVLWRRLSKLKRASGQGE